MIRICLRGLSAPASIELADLVIDVGQSRIPLAALHREESVARAVVYPPKEIAEFRNLFSVSHVQASMSAAASGIC
jgi:hypothetical protein